MNVKIGYSMKLLSFMVLFCVLMLAGGCASPKKLLELEQEVNRLKITVEVLEKSNVEMNMKLDALNVTLQKIEESVLKNSEQLDKLVAQQEMSEKTRSEREKASDFVLDELYVPETKPSGDLDRGYGESQRTFPPEQSMDLPTSMDPHQLYNNAFTHFKTGIFGKAILEFEEFVSRFPEHNLADNAQYWIGEVYYSQKDYNRALHEFQKVLDLYPLGNKVPDAMLKIGFSFKELREYRKSLDQFQKVIERFPDSDAAIKAREQMEIIRSEQ